MNCADGYKVCSKCLVAWPAKDHFYREPKNRDGLFSRCRECCAAYRTDNKEQRNEQTRRYHQENRERLLRQQKAYRETNKDIVRATQRRWKEANTDYVKKRRRERESTPEFKERQREYARQRYAKDPQRFAEYGRSRKARKQGALGFHTFDEVWAMYESQDGLCAYCEIRLFGKYHIEHMQPLSRGGSDDWTNLALTCVTCNCSKQAKTLLEFLSELGFRTILEFSEMGEVV